MGSNTMKSLTLSQKTSHLLDQEMSYSAGGFQPVPAMFERAQGSKLWDVDGKEYIDFISMFSASNLGHSPPYIVERMTKQMHKASMINLAGHNASWPPFAEMMCRRFGYDKIIAMTSGTEAVDTACKIARKWGIQSKGINAENCVILGVGSSYHGLGSGVWSLMDPGPSRSEYGLNSKTAMNVNPSTGESLAYLDLDAMKRCLEQEHQRVAAVIMECLHGTSRTVEEEVIYARGVYDLCKKHNVLLQADIVTMGKSITGGLYPQSFVLGVANVMSLVGPYQMASSYASTPLAVAAAEATFEMIDNENLMDRAMELGKRWRAIVESWNHPKVNYVASIGADSNLFLKDTNVSRLAALCMHKGLFTYPRPDGLRLSFPMTLTVEELEAGAAIILEALDEIDQYDGIAGERFPC
ncbi:acetylornithine aminotransferase [Pochonia chlamydosporia 170]|uniref:Ornithine aminotransferase n=1 Tax=Pochonia chlamydosporia 170 TaxID=1380566 RepID=A0A179FS02_METCM|nr:acetylornithine aminotransferase [Pochonia chlamydosporia 170]OAQ67799.1 acetylornithine aminotransferase [Pochonia chlamydosporia 170]